MSQFFNALEQTDRECTSREQPGRRAQASLTTSRPSVVQLADRSAERQMAEDPLKGPDPRPSPRPAAAPGRVEEHLVSLLSPTSFEAEQYRTLRYMVEQLNRNAELQVLAVTSPAVGDGKTITAINLAGALAQAPGVRILLVEADLRKPTIANLLGLPPTGGPGLVDAILDPAVSLDDVVRPRPPFNMSILPGGHPQLSPYELLKSPRLTELVEEMRRRYDYVVLDTPPLVPFPDCRVLQRYINGLIMVIGAHKTPRKLVEEALNIVDQTKIIGLVFNGANRPRLGYYYNSLYGQSPNEHGRGWLRSILAKVGDSLWHRHGRSPAH